MYFNKFPYRSNFEFLTTAHSSKTEDGIIWNVEKFDLQTGTRSQDQVELKVQALSDDVYVISAQSSQWQEYLAQSELKLPAVDGPEGFTVLDLAEGGAISLKTKNGQEILSSVPEQGFGKAGEAHVFQFIKPEDSRFYGMGEKMLGLELSGVKTKFWNTDVWADFHHSVFENHRPDPSYVSIPYLIMKSGAHWIGLLLDNPEATFIRTSNHINIAGQMEADEQQGESILLGSEGGLPRLIIIAAQSLAELTRKFQGIVGNTPLPPVWSLGYHQCRWGYENLDDLNYLDAGMNKHQIPCDGLWLDIDYMRGYRVFTFENKYFPDPQKNIHEFQSRGRRIVPIIDPGVKAEAGYDIYESGKAGNHFCLNPQGREFIGLVWPGETVFPDFSQAKTREWWSDQVEKFAHVGITAAWLDMNDPATGDSLNDLMRFDGGRKDHKTYHNQYALGMARASREGFEKARPNERAFLLSRSGFTGMSKYAALWTGDNISNYHYLKSSIACSLNLALSGVPFNGPDVGGFGSDSHPQLMKDWIKAGFLFPFLRNHSNRDTHNQEPWAFDQKTLKVFRHYVQLRYYLRPYLYNLFVNQAEKGEAILRPMFYNFENDPVYDFSYTDDQFMVGDSILQAPFVNEDQQVRSVVLPSACHWYDVREQKWLEGGQKIIVQKCDGATPLYIRQGSILPLAREKAGEHRYDLKNVDFHIFLAADQNQKVKTSYTFDDGLSMDYTEGARSKLLVEATVNDKTLALQTTYLQQGFGEANFRIVLVDQFDDVTVNGKTVDLENYSFSWTDKASSFKISGIFE
jgi:alpha-glucosidase